MFALKFDDIAEIYDKTRGIPSARILKALVNELTGLKSVLDVGVGTGRFAKPLMEYGFKVVGIDVSRGMIRLAKKKDMEELVRGDVCKMPFKNKRFDCALLVHMLHLITDWHDLLFEIARVTKEKLVSVAGQIEPKKLSMRHLYLEMIQCCGFKPRNRIEGEEIELAKLVKPEKCYEILSTQGTRIVDKIIDALDQRRVTQMWGVPEDIHGQVVRELRKKYAGKKVDYRYHTFLIVWNINDILAETVRRHR